MIQAKSYPQYAPGSMLRSLVTVSGASGLSLTVGLIQNIAITAIIGATASKDAFDVASCLPLMMMYMFGLDLFKGISIGLFSRLDVNKSEDPSEAFSSLVNSVILLSFLAIVMAEIFVGPLVQMIGKGLEPETSQFAVRLARFMIPTLGLIAINGLIGSILLANHYYGLNEALTIFPKLAMLIGVLGWGKTLDVWVLVIAIIVGLLAKLPVMFYFLRRSGLRYSMVLKVKSPAVRSAFIDAVPIGLGAVVVYVSQILMQRTASYGQEGTIACFNYSLLICGTLSTLVCRPIYAALTPRVARSLEAEDYQASSKMLAKSMGLLVLICLASTSIILAEAPLIVDILFGRGRFAPEAIEQTSGFLMIMSIGILGIGVRMLAVGILLARRRSKTIMAYCIITSITRSVLAVAGRKWWGVHASAIAHTGGACIDGILCIIATIWLTKLYQRMGNAGKICRWLVACLVVIVLPVIPHLLYPVSYTEPLYRKLLQLGIVSVVTGFSFLLAARLIKLYTVKRILSVIKKTVNRFRQHSGLENEGEV